MNIFLIGAGQVGATVVEALHGEHHLTVFDLDPTRLHHLSYRYDVRTVEGNGASRRTLQDAGAADADLLIACTSRDEVNIIAAMFSRLLSPATKTIVRTTNVEYLEVWHERQLDVDFIVSAELETAHAVSALIGLPAARQTDVFADGQVQIVEFDVPAELGTEHDRDLANLPLSEAAPRAASRDGRRRQVVGRQLRDAYIPPESKVASIIRGGEMRLPRGTEAIHAGDRIVIIGSPAAAKEWSELMAPGTAKVDDLVVFGGGRIGTTVARVLLDQGIRVRLIEADRDRAREIAELLPDARVYHATGLDPDFLERERIGASRAAVFAMREDAKNHYAATLAKLHGVKFTIGIVHEAVSAEVFERSGVDVSLNPRSLTAEEIVRHAHDPRVQQLAMLEGDRYEIVDITVRPESTLVNTRFRELPMTGALIGAIIRDGKAIFPRGDDVLLPGDRAIIFSESSRVAEVERAL
jgi:trk system potassium uptake protein TrkA